MIPKMGYAQAKSDAYSESVLPSLLSSLLIGLREALQRGFEPQELADRIGPLIDTMREDIDRRDRGDWQ